MPVPFDSLTDAYHRRTARGPIQWEALPFCPSFLLCPPVTQNQIIISHLCKSQTENYPGVREIKDWSPEGAIVRQALGCTFYKVSLQKQPPDTPIVLLNSSLQSTLQRCSIVIGKRSIHFSFVVNCKLCLFLSQTMLDLPKSVYLCVTQSFMRQNEPGCAIPIKRDEKVFLILDQQNPSFQ